MTFSIFLDLFVLAILIGTLTYAIFLNRRLNHMDHSRAELTQFLDSFTSSILKAESSVNALKSTGETTFVAAESLVQKGSILKDELSFLVERGDQIAEKLDNAIRTARIEQSALESNFPAKNSVPSNDHPKKTPVKNRAQTDMMKRLKNVR